MLLISLYTYLHSSYPMRALLLLLVLGSGAAFAQFEKADAELLRCERSCCESAGGNWSGSCSMTVYTSDYNSCEDRCLENATGAISGSAPRPDFCCAPAFLLLAIAGFAVLRA